VDIHSEIIFFPKNRFLDPLVLGNYPVGIRNAVASQLPPFIEEQGQWIKGSLDFV
jgi:beta-glucosidase